MRLFLFLMRHIILFDTDLRSELLPITLTRPVSEIRWGILTNREKWNRLLKPVAFSHITSEDLEPIYPISIQDHNTLINGSVIPTDRLADLIKNLRPNEALMLEGELIAALLPKVQFERLLNDDDLGDLVGYELDQDDAALVKHLWELTEIAQWQIELDMKLIDRYYTNAPNEIDVDGDHPLYVHPSAKVERAYFNTVDGPIYIGEGAHIMDGVALRGPVVINDGSVVKINAAIYGGTVVGKNCVVAGEVKRSLFFDHASKGHEGYLGDSVIGSWCNLAALTTSSNLKNTLSNIKVWHTPSQQLKDTGQLKCGIFMADYCRTGIQTRINAGTVIGISCHLFGSQIYSGYVPSFTWGVGQEYELSKAIETIRRAMALKGVVLENQTIELIDRICAATTHQRNPK